MTYYYNNDKITVGSDYTVRGYRSSGLYGDVGGYLKTDLIKNIKLNTTLLNTLSPFTGLDTGWIRCKQDNQYTCGRISGMAIGLKAVGKHLQGELIWSKPLKIINAQHTSDTLFRFDFTWKI